MTVWDICYVTLTACYSDCVGHLLCEHCVCATHSYKLCYKFSQDKALNIDMLFKICTGFNKIRPRADDWLLRGGGIKPHSCVSLIHLDNITVLVLTIPLCNHVSYWQFSEKCSQQQP